MTRVLFVDDEAAVLSGLRRQLHRLRDEWDMTFAESAEAALAHLAEHPVDAIVTDIRMPSVNGVELLEVVRDRHPETVRFVLSGQTCQRSSLQLTGLAHQFLAKPCDADELRSAVRRTLDLRVRVGNPAVVSVVSGLEGLPAAPTLYREVIELANDESVSVERIGGLLERDPAMTAKILQLVNSAFFGLRHEVSRPSQAASLLGLDTILTLVIGIEVFSTPVPPHVAVSVERLHRESLRAATSASRIAQAEGWPKERVSEVYLSGLMHDVGRLALTTALPDEYRPAGVGRNRDRSPTGWGLPHRPVGAARRDRRSRRVPP